MLINLPKCILHIKKDVYFLKSDSYFKSPEPVELIVYQSSRRLYVCLNIVKLEYLRNQWANRNQILSEASLGVGD